MMTDMTPRPVTADLVAFLRARLDEDAELARQAAEAGPLAQWDKDIDVMLGSALRLRRRLADGGVPDALAGAALAHAARHDPTRVLRQTAVLRDMVDLWSRMVGTHAQACLRAVAAIWADHPDYREEWAL